jgi:hypothetical protein
MSPLNCNQFFSTTRRGDSRQGRRSESYLFEKSVIKRTGQWWKAQAAFWSVIASAAVMVIGLACLRDDPHVGLVMVVTGICVAAAAAVIGIATIHCPACRARWVWLAATGRGSNEWLSWLLSVRACSQCERDNNDAASAV